MVLSGRLIWQAIPDRKKGFARKVMIRIALKAVLGSFGPSAKEVVPHGGERVLFK